MSAIPGPPGGHLRTCLGPLGCLLNHLFLPILAASLELPDDFPLHGKAGPQTNHYFSLFSCLFGWQLFQCRCSHCSHCTFPVPLCPHEHERMEQVSEACLCECDTGLPGSLRVGTYIGVSSRASRGGLSRRSQGCCPILPAVASRAHTTSQREGPSIKRMPGLLNEP